MAAVSLLLLVPKSSVIGLQRLGFNGMSGAIPGATYPVVGWAFRQPRGVQ
jgi:hypothetical protein